MYLIIDAYNVLKGLFDGAYIDERQRALFIARLGSYARKKGHAVALVFDGGDFSYPVKETVHGIQVYYAGHELTADRFIKRLLKQAPHKDQTLVISTDREVKDAARRLAVKSLSSQEFVEMLRVSDEALAQYTISHAPLVKTSQDDNPELDALLEQATEQMPIKKDDQGQAAQRQSAQLSKHDRKLQDIKKKL